LCHMPCFPGTMQGTPCPNKSMLLGLGSCPVDVTLSLLGLDPRYERYGTGIFPFDGTCTGTGILLPVPSSPVPY
jgi:hypothetical protein